uniref:Uncharacterized protein n=1 Tax=viral metagenome TaxID=1070528 RepID=A0A6C0BY35_9ZZZZ
MKKIGKNFLRAVRSAKPGDVEIVNATTAPMEQPVVRVGSRINGVLQQTKEEKKEQEALNRHTAQILAMSEDEARLTGKNMPIGVPQPFPTADPYFNPAPTKPHRPNQPPLAARRVARVASGKLPVAPALPPPSLSPPDEVASQHHTNALAVDEEALGLANAKLDSWKDQSWKIDGETRRIQREMDLRRSMDVGGGSGDGSRKPKKKPTRKHVKKHVKKPTKKHVKKPTQKHVKKHVKKPTQKHVKKPKRKTRRN